MALSWKRLGVASLRLGASRASSLARFWATASVLRLLPLDWAYELGRWHGRRAYRRRRSSIGERAAEMQRRLSATPEEVERWLERYFELIFSEKVEAHLYRRASVADITRMIEVRGLHNLDRALERGKGAILYSGHVAGHFTFYVALGLLGYRLNMVGFPAGMEQWIASRRNAFMEDRLGHRRLQMQRGNFGIAVKAVNALRRNGIVTIEIDHPHAGPKVEVEFLGIPGYLPRGPAEIASASGAPLLAFWIHRPDEWRPQVAEIGPPYYVSEGDIDSALVHCASVLEHSIRSDPPSWLPWLFPRRRVWER